MNIGVQDNAPMVKTLDSKKMYALIVIEQNRDSLAQNELQQAEQQFRTAQNNLELAKKGLAEVQGAIIGANIMIERELAADGFTLEDWQNIKAQREAEYAKEQEAEQPQEPAPAQEPVAEEPVPDTPSAKITHLKRRGR